MKKLLFAAVALSSAATWAELVFVPGVKIPNYCYFDTEYDVTSNPRVTMRYSRDSVAVTDIFGGLTKEDGCFILDIDSGAYYYRYGTLNANGAWAPVSEPNEIVTAVCDADLVIDGKKINPSSVAVGDFTKSTETMTFPGRRYPMAISVFSFKLEDHGEVVRDMVPAVQDGVVGFWDKKNEKFYPPSGSGTPTVRSEDRDAGQRLVWTGAAGDGKLSTPGNWEPQVAPLSWAGDTLVFDSSKGAVTVENDIPGLSVGAVRMQGERDTIVTINGQELVLTTEVAWSNEVPVVVNAPLRHQNVGNRKAEFRVYNHLTLNGALTFQSTTNAIIVGYRPGTPAGKERENCAFNGDITGRETTLELRSANSQSIYYDFYGKLTLACFKNGCNYGGMTTTLYNPSNEIAMVVGAYQPLTLADDALHGAVFLFDGYYRETSTTPLKLTGGKSYVLDRIGDTGKTWEAQMETKAVGLADVISSTSGTLPIDLTLRGAGDATTAGYFGNYPLSLTWDPVGDYTQEFRNRFHLMTGDVNVKGGTLRLAGTNVFQNVTRVHVFAGATLEIASTNALYAAFPALELLYLDDGATLKVSEPAAHPFATDHVGVVMASGAKISAVEGATVDIGRVSYGGQEVEASDYTSADWLTGGGTVKVSGRVTSAKKVWWRPSDGNWGEAENWLGGVVPAAGDTVDLSALGDYAVTVRASDAVPGTLNVNDAGGTVTVKPAGDVAWGAIKLNVGVGGRIEVPEGTSLGISGAANVAVAGGLVLVDGGTLSVTNFGGKFELSGVGATAGRLTVTSGCIVHHPTATDKAIAVNAGGLLEMSGGWIEERFASARPINMNGGRTMLSGEAYLKTAAKKSDGNPDRVNFFFNASETVFSERSYVNNTCSDSYLYIQPQAKDAKAVLTLRDQAQLLGGPGARRYDSIVVGSYGSTAYGPAELNLESDVDHRGGNSDGFVAYGYRVGCGLGTGVVNQCAGFLQTSARGVRIGMSNGGRWGGTETGGNGTYNLSGGCLSIQATSIGEGTLNGVMVGNGGAIIREIGDPWPTTIYPMTGRFNQTGGIVTNLGNTCVGGPRATGDFEQTGGLYRGGTFDTWDKGLYPFVVGAAGGTGRCLLGGGTTEIAGDVYVGGVFTNVFRHGTSTNDWTYNLVALGWPLDAHSAVGTLTVTGGTVTIGTTAMTKNLNVGFDGTGMVAVEGALADITLNGDLVLSNTTETATSSTLRFKLDETGVSPIKVSGKVVNTPGTKLVIDVGSSEAKRKNRRLIRCENWEGPAITDVTFVGERADEASLRSDAFGLYVGLSNGSLILMR